MKGFSIFVAISFLACSASQADWRWSKDKYPGAKSPMVEERITSPSYCYDAGWEFSIYAAGYWPEDGLLDDAGGGGLGLGYYFGPNLGIDMSYTLLGGGDTKHLGLFNLVYRMPIGGECCSTIAPYIFGGPGVFSYGDSDFLWNVGAGMDFRFEAWGCIGLFADYSWNFTEDPAPDFGLFRAGLKVPF